VFPQVTPGAVDRCARAIDAVRHLGLGAAGATSSIPAQVEALLDQPGLAQPGGNRQVEAERCLGHALAFGADPVPERFVRAMDAKVAAQHREFAHRARARQAWIGWLDDVVNRSDRFGVDAMLAHVERTLRGTLDVLPAPYEWEGTADDAGRLEIWTTDPRSRRLVTLVMVTEPLRVEARTLLVCVLDERRLVRDPLRIEYFVEHMLHRRFLGAMHAGEYDRVEYRCPGTSESWCAPVARRST
jgi:hypothetical protein